MVFKLVWPQFQVSSCAGSLFILAGVKAPEQVKNLMQAEFEHKNPQTRLNALLKFQVLWKCRHQVWPRMEENSNFKAPPPSIEFTLPSPRYFVHDFDPVWFSPLYAVISLWIFAFMLSGSVLNAYLWSTRHGCRKQKPKWKKLRLTRIPIFPG